MCARCVMALFVFAILFAVGCQRTRGAAPGSHEADVNSLRDVELAEEQAWSSKNLEKILSFYADDATLMYPNMPAIVGKDSIRAYMKPFFADPAFTVQYQITRVDVAQSGDLGYTQGTQTYTMTDPKTGKSLTDRGKWLTVRKKQADGSWKIVRDAASSDLPLPVEGKLDSGAGKGIADPFRRLWPDDGLPGSYAPGSNFRRRGPEVGFGGDHN